MKPLFFVTIISALLAFCSPVAAQLLQQSDLEYLGAFRLPTGSYGCVGLNDCFSYGGHAMAYNPANNSLFIASHDQRNWVGEITIPTPSTDTIFNNLPRATVLQNFIEATEGKKEQFNTGNGSKIGGLMVYGGRLYITAYNYYDAGGNPVVPSHFIRPLNLSTTGQVAGPFTWNAVKNGFISGWMTPIPSAKQSALGGMVLTGNCCLSIIARTSFGPALYSFNPGDLETVSPVPNLPLLDYPSTHTTLGAWNGTSSVFNGTTIIHGAVFPGGTNSVLFFGRQGVGAWCYGPGTNNPALAGTMAPSGQIYCYDPTSNATGPHAYPYVYQVWAYNADDLVRVKNGEQNPWDVVPYATWQLNLPFANVNAELGGVGYDPATQRLYVHQRYASTYGQGVVYTFKVNPPPPPVPAVAITAQPGITINFSRNGGQPEASVSVIAPPTMGVQINGEWQP